MLMILREDHQTDFHKRLQKMDLVETYNFKMKIIDRTLNMVRLLDPKNIKAFMITGPSQIHNMKPC